ncbi:MAG TPA: IPT/TIG domain-containing protein, partial [Actinomycetota bacterium]|nr:IPT/TIG domain-containing protein [Actinomycetota bacterium]
MSRVRRPGTASVVVAGILGFLVGALGLPAAPPAFASTAASPITYVYDDIGRLEAVIDASQTNGLAKYIYDAVGNLTQITRTAITTTPAVVDFHSHRAPIGSAIRIYGTGFSSTASQDVVTFTGGTTATATAATATTLTVTVPAAAQAGPIKVKNTAVNITSPLSTQSWSAPTPAPTITSVTSPSGWVAGNSANPPMANYGDTITVNGTGFSTNPMEDLVRLNSLVVPLLSVTATQMTFKVPAFDTSLGKPPYVSSGSVTVTTAAGTATSPKPLIVPDGGPITNVNQVQ